jgi:hypothetical protein
VFEGFATLSNPPHIHCLCNNNSNHPFRQIPVSDLLEFVLFDEIVNLKEVGLTGAVKCITVDLISLSNWVCIMINDNQMSTV